MRKIFLIIFMCLFSVQMFSRTENDSILQNLFYILNKKSNFDNDKEEKIAQIKKRSNIPNLSDNQQYNINNELQNEYHSYKIDLAILYLEKNLLIAKKLQNFEYLYRTKLTLSSMYWQTGKFFEALQLVESINRKQIPDELLSEYFEAYKRIYKYYADFQNDADKEFFKKSVAYRDSLMNIIDCNSKRYQVLEAEILTEKNETQQAAKIIEELFEKSVEDSHDRAIMANVLANIYRQQGDTARQIKYFALSAVCDIKNSVKENASMLALALLLYEQDNIDDAYHCLQSAMDDAMFCNAHFRTYEISKIFPIINSAYQGKMKKHNSELKLYLLLACVLSVFLIFAIIVIYRYLHRIAKIRKELYHTNVKLQNLNVDLQNSNNQLTETNLIKELYLAKFIDLCSNYIEKLDNYRRSLNRFVRDGKMDELVKELKSSKFIDSELDYFYINFDETFLRIYPTFVKDFNAFFPENDKLTLKPNEILNTELRIFALIRLGISDSSKIALFLRCSITTIYTYRSKLKKKSLFTDNLEEEVMKIGR